MPNTGRQPGRAGASAACGLALILTTLALTACGGPPTARTTFLNAVDLVHMTDQMAQSFANDEMISERTPQDEPWVISIYRVVNHTNQIIREHERWLYLGRLRAQLAQSNFSDDRSVIWVIPPERWPLVADELGPAPPELRMRPTHLLTAEFNVLTQTHARGRSDAYVCSYQLVDLESGSIVWEDAWEVKRAIAGLTFD
jgi:acetyl esterase/lipase